MVVGKTKLLDANVAIDLLISTFRLGDRHIVVFLTVVICNVIYYLMVVL